MGKELRKTGLEIIGDMPWGTHICQFYKTKKDLIDILVPYFKSGLENNEFCIWITSKPLSEKDAAKALKKVLPDLDSYLKKGQIEIIPHDKWYTKKGIFSSKRVLGGWVRKLDKALSKGYDGLRLTGNTFWLEKKDCKGFVNYEQEVDNFIKKYRMIALCTYSLDKCKASEVVDIVRNHQFALIVRQGKLEFIESFGSKRAEDEIKHFASFPQLNPNPVLEVDSSGKIIFYNDAATKVLKELNHTEDVRVFLPDDIDEILKVLKQKREVTQFRRLVNIKDRIFGEALYVAPSFNSVRIYAHDVTERMRTEETLRKSEKRYRSYIEVAGQLGWTTNADGEVFEDIPSWRAYTGQTYDEIKGWGWATALHPDDKEYVKHVWEKAVIEKSTYEVEYRIRRHDGIYRHFMARGIPVLKEDGSVLEWVGTCVDITDLKQRGELSDALNSINSTLNSTLDLDEIMQRVIAEASRVIGAETAAVSLKKNGHWVVSYVHGFPKEVIGAIMNDEEEPHAVLAVKTKQPVAINDALSDERVNREHMKRWNIRSVLVVPLVVKDAAIGVIFFNYHASAVAFTKVQIDFAEKLGASLSISLENARLFGEIKQSEKELRRSRDGLEIRVLERTAELKKAHEALIEQSKILEGFFTSTVNPMAFLDRDFNFVRVNEAYAKACQRDVSEFAGHNHFEFYPHEENEAIFRRVVESKLPYQAIAKPFVFPDHPEWGITYWDWMLAPLSDDTGEVEFLVFSLNDVTERKKVEQELLSSERKYRSLIEQASDGIAIIDQNLNIIDVNPAVSLLLGYSKEELCNLTVRDLVPEEELPDILLRLKDILVGETVIDEKRQRCKDGRLITTELSVRMLDDGNIQTIFRDITERKRAEEAVNTERQRLFSVLEQIPAYVCLLTADYKFVYVNQEFKKRFGDPGDRYCHEYLFDYQKPCEGCNTFRIFTENLKAYHWEWTGPDGNTYAIFDYPFTDVDGSPLILEMGMDITERKKAEEKVRDASRYSRSLIEASLDPLVTISAEGKIMDVNKATELVTGVDREHLIGSDFLNYFTEPEKAREGYKKVFIQETVRDYPLAIRHLSGRITEVLYNATVYRNETGEVQGIFAAARDVTEQKKMEKSLRRTEEKYRNIYENSIEGIFQTTPDGRYITANPALVRMLGYESSEKLLAEITNVSQIYVDPHLRKEFVRLVEERDSVTGFEYQVYRKDGAMIWISENAHCVRDEGGKILYYEGTVEDITERKETERRINANNTLLKLFAQTFLRSEYLDNVVELIQNWSDCRNVGIRVLDDEGNIPYESFMGFSKAFMESENLLSVNRDMCVCIRAVTGKQEPQDASVMTPGGSFYCNNTFKFVNSLSEEERTRFRGMCIKTGYASVAVIPIRYRDEIIGAIHLADERESKVLIKDIEFIESMSPLIGEAIYRFNIEEKLMMSKASLAEAQRIAHLGNWEWDIQTDKLYWSDEVYRIFGLSPQQVNVTYNKFLSYIHPEDREFVKKAVNEAVYGGPYSIDHRIVLDDGTVRIVHEQGEVAFGESGEPVRMIGTVQDITEKRETEMRLIMSERLSALGMMASGIAHEINNPLATIGGCAEGLLSRIHKGTYDPELFQSYLKIIEEEITRCKSITTNMLSFVRKRDFEKNYININEILDKTLELVSLQGRLKEVEVRRNYEENMPLINESEGELRQVFLALITNAIDSMEEKGVLTLETGAENNEVFIKITDTGQGIPPDIISRIFDPFFTTKGQGGGVGLGLSIARKTIFDNNGRLDVTSEERKGTTFKISLPKQST